MRNYFEKFFKIFPKIRDKNGVTNVVKEKIDEGGRFMSKKRIVLLSVSVILVFVLVILILSSYAWFYTEEQHIHRIRERAERRFLGEDSEYTGLEVYPIYNEYDEMRFALIEFEPQGFIFVHIKDQAYPWKGMYTLSSRESECWMPYRVKEGYIDNIYDADGKLVDRLLNREFLRDENGQVIIYHESYFKVAGIENERRYFLWTDLTITLGRGSGLIPAVKRGEQYLDLVDGEIIDYNPGMESMYAIADIGFINKSYFDL